MRTLRTETDNAYLAHALASYWYANISDKNPLYDQLLKASSMMEWSKARGLFDRIRTEITLRLEKEPGNHVAQLELSKIMEMLAKCLAIVVEKTATFDANTIDKMLYLSAQMQSARIRGTVA